MAIFCPNFDGVNAYVNGNLIRKSYRAGYNILQLFTRSTYLDKWNELRGSFDSCELVPISSWPSRTRPGTWPDKVQVRTVVECCSVSHIVIVDES